VALGVAEEWAQRVGTDSGPTPDWYVSSSGAPVWPALVAFSSAGNPALAPPASTSGGGSTYVGGAAGGGGGGSW
jgi:uncharacterized membrane protein